jgi:DNA topoisomerase III
MRVLNVAEKNSVAREIAKQLGGSSGGNLPATFPYTLRGIPCEMTVTAVRGHLTELDFSADHRSWNGVDPITLFSAPVVRSVNSQHRQLVTSLRQMAARADWLVLWLDCDREGEAIAYEVMEVCLGSNRRLEVFRAHFSALSRTDLVRACDTLGRPNQALSEAVLARSEIDLRIGAAFTRWLTLRFQNQLGGGRKLVSFGPCQFPTLGFIVAAYLARNNFVPENFWTLALVLKVTASSLTLSWCRGRLFSHTATLAFRNMCLSNTHAVVVEKKSTPKTHYRPLPMNTIDLAKACSSRLHIPSHRSMQLAEQLYMAGYISYPRTETNIFAASTDFRALVREMERNSQWGGVARQVLAGACVARRGTRDDQAHPPIHPLKNCERNAVDPEQWRVYELICLHFLSCLAPDARGSTTSVDVAVGDWERFTVSGSVIDRSVFTWMDVGGRREATDASVEKSEILASVQIGQQLPVLALNVISGQTSAPSLLSESALIDLMDRNGIGTDATMHEHIKTVQERNYCFLDTQKFFQPYPLGVALVVGMGAYADQIHLAKPSLRAAMEADMALIARGGMTRQEFLGKYIRVMREIFLAVTDHPGPLDREVRAVGGGGGGGGDGPPAPVAYQRPRTGGTGPRRGARAPRAPRPAGAPRAARASRRARRN